MIPIGGTFTMPPDTAREVLGQLKPKIAIPMHYREDMSLLGMFLKGFPNRRSAEQHASRQQNGFARPDGNRRPDAIRRRLRPRRLISHPSDFEGFDGFVGKELVEIESLFDEALLVKIRMQRFQVDAVRSDPVGPVVRGHQGACLLIFRGGPRKTHSQHIGIVKLFHAQIFSLRRRPYIDSVPPMDEHRRWPGE